MSGQIRCLDLSCSTNFRKTDQDENTLLSPYSLSVALAMARNGAAGETEQAIVSALQLQALDPGSINANYVYLQRALQAPDSKVTLEIANALWAADDIEFDPGFLDRNNQFLDTEIATLDFTEPTNVDTINDSINTNTNGAIPSVVEAIDPQTIACLISGIYFKGSWQEEFDISQTRDEPFTLADGSNNKHISMMRRTDWYPYYAGDQFQAVSLSYGDGQMSMYIFLPNPDTDLNTFLDRLNVENWEGWMSQFSEREVSLVMPKFELQYSAELKDALERLAMGIAFDEDRADFSRMTASSVPVFISYLTHTAVVEVNEEGTEASTGSFVFFDADVTTALAEESVPPIPFIVNRPFFLTIRDNQTGTVLFMGVVMDPTTVKKPPFIPEPPPYDWWTSTACSCS